MGVEKGQGLKKGEKVKRMHASTVLNTRWEVINDITTEDVVREGFPGKSREWFIEMYCQANRVEATEICKRIEFEHDEQ